MTRLQQLGTLQREFPNIHIVAIPNSNGYVFGLPNCTQQEVEAAATRISQIMENPPTAEDTSITSQPQHDRMMAYLYREQDTVLNRLTQPPEEE